LIPSAGRGLPSSPRQQVPPPRSSLKLARKLVMALPPAKSLIEKPPAAPLAGMVMAIIPLLAMPPVLTRLAVPVTAVPAGSPELKSLEKLAAPARTQVER